MVIIARVYLLKRCESNMAKSKKKEELVRKQVEVVIDCDTNRLYSSSIDETIKYLIEVRDANQGRSIVLDEHWSGYENMEMRFVYYREENDAEYEHRIKLEEYRAQVASQAAAREKSRVADLAEFNRLRKKLGMG